MDPEPGVQVPNVKQRRVPGAVKAKQPEMLQPQLCWPVSTPPDGEEWFHEIKFNGYRLLGWIDHGKVVLRTRNELDWTHRFPHLVRAMKALSVQSAILDGELVALRPNGVTNFEDLQAAFKNGSVGSLRYFVFDLLYLDGYDLRNATLERRKRALAELIVAIHHSPLTTRHSPSPIEYVDHVEGRGPQFFEECCRHELEGMVSKERSAPYRSGRGKSWLKIKCAREADFVIGGYTLERGTRTGLGALLLGHFDEQGMLRYTGKVGSGMNVATLGELRKKLGPLEQTQNPFYGLSRKDVARGTRWVQPRLVAKVHFADWTHDGKVRQAVFRGLREDLPASSVTQQLVHQETGRLTATRQGSAPPARGRKRSPIGSRLNDEGQLAQLAQVQLTSPQRMLYPKEGITKLDLATYYAEIADWILPHLVGRPLTLVRCPEGEEGDRFFQKHAAAGTPAALKRISLPDEDEEYLAVEDLAGLLSLVQMSVLEIHPSGARADLFEKPDRMVFDLDPGPGIPWLRVIDYGFLLRDFLEQLGLVSFVKTTGGKGLHIVVPLQRRHGWEEIKSFSQAVARHLAGKDKSWLTAGMSKAARQGRIYIDFHRNNRSATAVGAYSTRANPRATVSVPLAWDELSERIGADYFTMRNVRDRLAALAADPWADMSAVRQTITARAKRMLNE